MAGSDTVSMWMLAIVSRSCFAVADRSWVILRTR